MSTELEDGVVDAYWRQLDAAAERALRQSGVVEQQIDLAHRHVLLRFAGPALVDVVMPALSHLVSAKMQAADLTVLLADGATTAMAPPPLPWDTIPGQAWTLQTDRFSALHLPVLDSVLWFDRSSRRAIYWLPDAATCPLVERGSPLLTLWAWWLADRGLQLVHGAAVGSAHGAALLVGPSGSGKSTTSLLCVGSSLRYLADDYCIVDPQLLTVHSLYCSGKVAVDDAPRFEHLARYSAGHDHEKTLYMFHPADPPIVVRQLPLLAMIAPTVASQSATTVVPISTMAAVRAAAPSTVLQLRTGGSPGDALKRITTLASRVPCHRMDLGTDFERIPALLGHLLG
ncbi:MAG: hypothetical protein ABL961_01505 [Vicinamibacterales bacterium]